MKLNLYLVFGFTVVSQVNTSAQAPVWFEHFGNLSSGNSPFILAGDADGSVYAFGTFAGPPMIIGDDTVDQLGVRDVLLIKFDTTGNPIWVRTAGSVCSPDDNEYAKSLVVNPSGDRVVVTGYHNCPEINFGACTAEGSWTLNPGDGFIASYDSAGTCQWATSATGFDVRPGEVLLDADHNTFWFGGVVTMTALFHDAEDVLMQPGGFVAKYDAEGDMLFAERWLTYGLIEDADWYDADEWLLCGSGGTNAALNGDPVGLDGAYSFGYFGDAWLARVDTAGTTTWVQPLLSDTNAVAYRCTVGLAGDVSALVEFQHYVVIGSDTIQGTGYDYRSAMASFNSAGELNWAYRFGGDDFVAPNDMERAPNGDIYVFGKFSGDLPLPGVTLHATTSLDMFVAKFDPVNGQCIAAYNYGKLGGYGSVWPAEHGFYVAGDYDSTFTMGPNVVDRSGPVANDLFIAKFDSLSGFTGIQPMPLQEGDLLIYANPNNGLCTIDLPDHLRLTEDLFLSVFDNTGHLVQRVPVRYTNDGVALDVRAQAKGIYHVELGDGRQRYTGTIVFE